MITTARSPHRENRSEKRRQNRTDVGLKGRLFIPQGGYDDECIVENFCTDGAGLKYNGSAPVGTRVVLYVECFGRFEGVVVRRDRVRLGLQFHSNKAKRQRTNEQLADFVAHGMTAVAPTRRGVRVKEMPPLQHFIDSDGRSFDCEVVDIALDGALFKTIERPEVGAVLAFGETAGRIVRHTDDGFAVQFIGRRSGDRRG